MAKRILFTDAMRAEADARLASCPVCDDDLGIHDWIEVTEADGRIVACDRQEDDLSTAIACDPARPCIECGVHNPSHRDYWADADPDEIPSCQCACCDTHKSGDVAAAF